MQLIPDLKKAGESYLNPTTYINNAVWVTQKSVKED
jgi:hypothetical protein